MCSLCVKIKIFVLRIWFSTAVGFFVFSVSVVCSKKKGIKKTQREEKKSILCTKKYKLGKISWINSCWNNEEEKNAQNWILSWHQRLSECVIKEIYVYRLWISEKRLFSLDSTCGLWEIHSEIIGSIKKDFRVDNSQCVWLTQRIFFVFVVETLRNVLPA